MQGYRIIFSTIRGRKHNGEVIHEWIINKSRELGIDGITVINALEGYGRTKSMHSADFFELTDQPIEIVILANEEKTNLLFDAIKEAKLNIFYAKTEAEFGSTIE